MAFLESSEGVLGFITINSPKTDELVSWKGGNQRSAELFCIRLSSHRKIHTSEYFSPLRRRLNSNLLHLEAEGEKEALKHTSCYIIWQFLFQRLHLPANSSSNRRKTKYSLPFLHPVLVIWLHFFLPGYSTPFREEYAVLALWKVSNECICKIPYKMLHALLMESLTVHDFTK